MKPLKLVICNKNIGMFHAVLLAEPWVCALLICMFGDNVF